MARGETIRLKGWAALIAIVLVGGFLAVKAFSAHSTLQSEAADLLKLQLAGEYASAHLSGGEDSAGRPVGTVLPHGVLGPDWLAASR